MAASAALLVSACAEQTKIAANKSFHIANPFSDRHSGAVAQVCWATEEILIATGWNRMIQAFDATSGKELWRKEFPKSIEAITSNAQHVFVALASFPREGEEDESIRRIDVNTGMDSTPPSIPQPFLPHALIWNDELDVLSVLNDEELWIYSPDLQSVQTRIPYAGSLPFVSQAGKFILIAEGTGSCTLIDLAAASASHVHGPPNKGQDNTIAIDAPFLSNAFAAGDGRLIRVVDNSWATGRVYFHPDPTAEPREIDSENGHAVAAVHWPTKRLAVSGTEKNLILFSTSGDRLGSVRHAATDRVYSLDFSPSGARIAALSSDAVVKIFDAP